MKKIIIISLVLLFSSNVLADVTVNKNRIVCENESGIQAIVLMKELKRIKQLPNSCRTLGMKRKGNVTRLKNKHYVKIKTKAGGDFYTLTKWVKF